MRTDNLRRQHDAALVVAAEMRAAIAAAGDAPSDDDSYRLAIHIVRLTGALRIHFAQEDRVLYPMLMASRQGGVAEVARRFFADMGQIGPAVADYGTRWRTSAAIRQHWVPFRQETEALFGVLAQRIALENDELYPLADAAINEARAGPLSA